VFILLPGGATAIGTLQSKKSLRAESHRVLPPEYTRDNFAMILSGGAQKGLPQTGNVRGPSRKDRGDPQRHGRY